MDTKHYVVDRDKPDSKILSEAAANLRSGKLVAFPTETVYGLGANGFDEQAVKSIYQAKGRPSDNPLILHIAAVHEVEKLTQNISANARALMAAYWPGPLTIILERSKIIPNAVTGGLDTVAIRMPSSIVARELIRLAGIPVAAPSANVSGRPSPTNADDVLVDLSGKIAVVLDAGPCDIGVESTIVDCTTPVPTILRPGGITLEMLVETLGDVEVDPGLVSNNMVARAPGMKYRHYAPIAPMTLVESPYPENQSILLREILQALGDRKKVGAAVSRETAALLPADVQIAVLGSRLNPAEYAGNLYTMLRAFDDTDVETIFAEGISEEGLGLAVMNRLRKASGYRIIKK
ncbi:MAG: threonylcarbamoyl-AMP synthase [Pelosinus sp.]|nr:threonylcarbamoyl-AMP synthase [Pelosinus sp.]